LIRSRNLFSIKRSPSECNIPKKIYVILSSDALFCISRKKKSKTVKLNEPTPMNQGLSNLDQKEGNEVSGDTLAASSSFSALTPKSDTQIGDHNEQGKTEETVLKREKERLNLESKRRQEEESRIQREQELARELEEELKEGEESKGGSHEIASAVPTKTSPELEVCITTSKY
jgi:hypothetical protein